jgi:hypothetical protein
MSLTEADQVHLPHTARVSQSVGVAPGGSHGSLARAISTQARWRLAARYATDGLSMTSPLHEAPIAALRQFPELLLYLAKELFDTPLPAGSRVREVVANFSEVAVTEYRADAVFLIEAASGRAVVAVIVEVQRKPDEDKPYRWLRYAARVHDEHRCDTHHLVIATDEITARWAQRPIPSFLPGRSAAGNAPVVLSPQSLAPIASVEEAKSKLGQAILTALLHAGAADDIDSAYRALRALHETAGSEAAALDRIWWLLGLIGGILSQERFTELERLVVLHPDTKFVPRTEFERQPFNRGKAEGRAEGEAKGKAAALLRVLAARHLVLSDEQHQRIVDCQDQSQLERWLDASVTILSIAALLDTK